MLNNIIRIRKYFFRLFSGSGGGKHNNVNSNTHASQHACSSLCDEVVVLWRLAALNPGLAPSERDMLHSQVIAYFIIFIYCF